MRSFHKMFFVFAILLYTSCAEETNSIQNGSTQGDTSALQLPSPDSVRWSASPDSLISPDTLPQLLRDWEDDLRSKGISFDIDNFFAQKIDTFDLYLTGPWDGHVNEGYVLSPGKKYYSYFLSGWNDGDADTYVYLINIAEQKEYIVSVIGTCCSYEGTGWLNDHTLIAIGYNSYPADEKYPGKELTQGFYTIFDLNTVTSVQYSSKNYFRRPF